MWKTRRHDEHARMSVKVCKPQTPTTYTSNTYLAVDSTMERDDVRHKRHAAIYYSARKMNGHHQKNINVSPKLPQHPHNATPPQAKYPA